LLYQGAEMNKSLVTTRSAAISVVRLFIGKIYDPNRTEAVLFILKHVVPRSKSVVATTVVSMCLDYARDKPSVLLSFENIRIDQVSLALAVSENFPIARPVAERLIEAAAVSGFQSHFPELPLRLVGRNMNGDDVIALVSAYVSRYGGRCEQQEETLLLWAKRLLSGQDFEKQKKKIVDFAQEYEATASI
jgi:hypothetical protein